MNDDTKTKTVSKHKKPDMWKVIAINDDFTPMDFVIYLLVNYFGHDVSSATSATLEIHKRGSAVAGIYTMEIAETKLGMVADNCRQQEFPFRMILEPE